MKKPSEQSRLRVVRQSRGADILDFVWPEATQNPKNPRRATLVKAKLAINSFRRQYLGEITENGFSMLLWTDKSLHDLVETYAEITPKLRGKTRHPRRPKLAAARSAAANFVRRLCRVFPRNSVVIST